MRRTLKDKGSEKDRLIMSEEGREREREREKRKLGRVLGVLGSYVL